jgi:hypothetical protein
MLSYSLVSLNFNPNFPLTPNKESLSSHSLQFFLYSNG